MNYLAQFACIKKSTWFNTAVFGSIVFTGIAWGQDYRSNPYPNAGQNTNQSAYQGEVSRFQPLDRNQIAQSQEPQLRQQQTQPQYGAPQNSQSQNYQVQNYQTQNFQQRNPQQSASYPGISRNSLANDPSYNRNPGAGNPVAGNAIGNRSVPNQPAVYVGSNGRGIRSDDPTFNRQVNYQYQENIPQPDADGYHQLPPIKPAPKPVLDRVSGNVQLQNLKSSEFEKKLLDKLGKRCIPITTVQSRESKSQFQMQTADGTMLEVILDRQSGQVGFNGSKTAVSAFNQIVKLLDSSERTGNMETDMVPFRGVNYKAVQQTISAIESTQNGPQANRNQPQMPMEFNNQPGPGNPPNPVGRQNNGVINQNNLSEATALIGQMTQSGIIGPVQLEVIDGLDIVVIRGKRSDVELVKELIRQIDIVGEEQEPEIVIHPMKNTDCSRVGTIVRLLYNEIYGTRRGSINITPLVKPNAILLIGKKESIETAVKLIDKLDVPVDPRHEFKVIHLKNASSDTVTTTITEFFQNRDQLGTQIRVTSDSRTNSIIIQGSKRDIDEAVALIQKMDASESEAVNVVKVYTLMNSNASNMATMIQTAIIGSTTGGGGGFAALGGSQNQQGTRRSMLEFRTIDTKEGEILRSGIITSDIRITADTQGNKLIVSAPAHCMPLFDALIKQLDQLPVAESQVKVFTIVNSDATSLYNMLQTLFQTQTASTANSNSTLTTRPGLSQGESSMVQMRFGVDVRTNSIIATGTAGDLAVVDAILLRLDEDEMQNRVVKTFRLLNASVSEVSNVINEYLRSERQIETAQAELFSTYEQFRREVVVVPETVTNTLIVSTTPRFFNDIRRIIHELDDRPPMVVIQVLIAEVTLTNFNEFGVQLGLQDSILFDRSVLSNGALVPGYNFNNQPLGNNATTPNSDRVGSQGITDLGVGRTGSNGYGGFVFSASSESVSVLVRALEERQKINVLSRPQITAIDNQRAIVQVGESVPYYTSQTTNSTITQNATYRDVGLILDVTPRINADGLVSMQLYAEKSTAGITTVANPAPRIKISKVDTMVSAMDGQTIIIGGLITNEDTSIVHAVPYISRIPVVGRLFEYSSRNCERKELILIMTPTIIRSEEDMEAVKMQEMQRVHVCAYDVMSISSAKNIRKRGDYYAPGESEVIHYDGYVPSESELPAMDQMQKMNPYVPGAPTPGQPELNNQPSASQPTNKKNPTVAPPAR